MSYNTFENVIIVDYDGVCAYWEHAFDMWMLSAGYKEKSFGSYEIHERYDISEELGQEFINKFNHSKNLSFLPPFKDAIKYIRKLHEDHGYVFHCITAIENTPLTYESRSKNIFNLFGPTPFEKLILCGSSKNKEQILEKYSDSECFWIEDTPKNAEYGLKYGLKCLLMDQHYNKNYNNPNIKRVYNWKEIYDEIIG